MSNLEQFNPENRVAALSPEERENIRTKASLRRMQAEMRRRLLELRDKHQEIIPGEKDEYVQTVTKMINQEMTGESVLAIPRDEITKIVETLEQKAQEEESLAPNLAALHYAKAAQARLATGLPFAELLENAQRAIDKSKQLPKNSANALFPEAIIIGIQTKLAKDVPEIDPTRIASAEILDESLLSDYALVLPEERRAGFLESFPEDQRRKVSILMDKALAPLLKADTPLVEGDALQRTSVRQRAQTEIAKSLENPEKMADKNLVKAVSEILKELGGEDSKRLLADLGKEGLARHGEKEKDRMKISYVARIVREVSEMDRNLGGNLAMKFLAKKEVPDKLFQYFCRLLVKNEYITEKARAYFSNQDNLPWMRKLIAEYPNQFNTVIETISKIPGYNPAERQEEIFSAIRDLDSLTPIIFNRYRLADERGKKELALKIRELKPQFFQNIPIKDILPARDREILSEMVYLAYKPVGMDFAHVQRFIEQLDDQTEDLEGFVFPKEGYPISFSGEHVFRLKHRKELESGRMRQYQNMMVAERMETEDQAVKKIGELLKRLAKGGTEFNDSELAQLLSLLSGDEFVVNFMEAYSQGEIGEDKYYHLLSGLKELLGVYLADNYPKRLDNFLSANPSIEQQLLKIWSNPDRRATVSRKLGGGTKGKEKEAMDGGRATMIDLLARMVSEKVLKSVKERINVDLNKFEKTAGSRSGKKVGDLKAYISKNVGSFFAKASAGICTSADVSLFKRDDHFHINIVENDGEVRGNIQAYVIQNGGKKSLVLRGLNPNTDFLTRISPEEFVQKIFDIGRRFVEANGMDKVYLAENLGAWHADSNREAIRSLLKQKYYREKNKKPFRLKIASSQYIDYIYEI